MGAGQDKFYVTQHQNWAWDRKAWKDYAPLNKPDYLEFVNDNRSFI